MPWTKLQTESQAQLNLLQNIGKGLTVKKLSFIVFYKWHRSWLWFLNNAEFLLPFPLAIACTHQVVVQQGYSVLYRSEAKNDNDKKERIG